MRITRGGRIAVTVAFVCAAGAQAAHADTFGGQMHAVRSKGALEGATLEPTGTRDARLPSSVKLETDAELVGADFRFDWMVDDVRLGGALMVFGVRGLRLAPNAAGDAMLSVDDGFGGSLEGFVGYEVLQGPVYLYVDLRTVAQGFEAPVELERAAESVASDFGRASLGLGPRLGMLVPVGHSLMIDLAAYQRVVGGLERTTAFVGLGYWENDRRDAFSDWLQGTWGGDL